MMLAVLGLRERMIARVNIYRRKEGTHTCRARLADIVATAASRASVNTVQVRVATVDVLALEPAVQRLMEVVQILRVAVGSTLSAGVVHREAVSIVHRRAPVFGGEPAVIASEGPDSVTTGCIQVV
jgi:hypothetical protein